MSRTLTLESEMLMPPQASVALRVLTSWMDGQAPALEDVKLLQAMRPALKYLPVDELACIVMEQHHHSI